MYSAIPFYLISLAFLGTSVLAIPMPPKNIPNKVVKLARIKPYTPPKALESHLTQGAVPSSSKAPDTSAPSSTTPGAGGIIMLLSHRFQLSKLVFKDEHTSTWELTDPNLRAKSFSTYDPSPSIAKEQQAAFLLEYQRTRAILGQQSIVTKGSSAILSSGMDENLRLAWLVGPSRKGQEFQVGFKDIPSQGIRACSTFLKEVVRPQFVEAMARFYQAHGLVHLNAVEANTMWDPKASKILGFLDFSKMDKIDGPLYEKRVQELLPGMSSKMTLDHMSKLMAFKYYPNELCTLNGDVWPAMPGTS